MLYARALEGEIVNMQFPRVAAIEQNSMCQDNCRINDFLVQ